VIELVDFGARLKRFDTRDRFVHGCLILIDLLGAGDAACIAIAGQGGSSQLQLGLVERDLPLRLVELSLIRAWINLEKQIARFNFRPFLERHLREIASHARDDVDRFDGVRATGKLDVVSHLALQGLAHGRYDGFRGGDLTHLGGATRQNDADRGGEQRTRYRKTKPGCRCHFGAPVKLRFVW